MSVADFLKWVESAHAGTESLGGSVWSAVTYPQNGTLPSSWNWAVAVNVFGYSIDALEVQTGYIHAYFVTPALMCVYSIIR